MACYYPLRAFPIGQTSKGKVKYQIMSSKCDYVYHPEDKKKSILLARKITDFVEVPCGKCLGCRLDYSRQWATRCILEAKKYQFNYVLTLTYDEDNIKIVDGVNLETGELAKVGTLVPEDLTKFMKDLRRYYEYHYGLTNIRFYACGEYGDVKNTHRPHFHVIVFNCPIFDLKEFFINAIGEKVYLSDTIASIWKKGQISVIELSWESAAYVARYVMKKVKGKGAKEFYEKAGIVPEFVRMSRSRGIGYDYFNENKDHIYECDEIIYKGKKCPQVVKPPKYFDKLYDLEEPEKMQKLKEVRRKVAEERMKLELMQTDLPKREYLKQKEANAFEKIKNLKRNRKVGSIGV